VQEVDIMPRRICTAWKLGLFSLLCMNTAPLVAQERVVRRPDVDRSVASETILGMNDSEAIQVRIEQLASPQFNVRERATMELLDLGEAALQPLKEVSGDVPFEVRERCRLIEQKISAQIFAERSRKFLLDSDPSNSYQLPGWESFRLQVGSSRTSKLLFLNMLERDRPLVRLISAVIEADSNSAEYRQQSELLSQLLTQRAEELNARLYTLGTPSIGELMTVLFAASAIKSPPPVEVNRMLLSASQLSFQGYLRQPGYRDCIKKLLGIWLPRTHEGMAPETLRLAMSLELPVVTQIARRHLSPNFDVATRSLAFQYMASYGEESDVPLLLEYASDEAVVEEFSDLDSGIAVARAAPPGVPLAPQFNDDHNNELNAKNRLVRISDMAVASSMMILHQDPRSIFPRFDQEQTAKLMPHELAASAEEAPKQAAAARAWANSMLEQIPRG
jgi:hypothetical protein